MEVTKDEELNKILARAEKYRSQYNEKFNIEKNAKFNLGNDIADIFEAFFGTKVKTDYNDKSNVFINCKLNKNEIKNGCTKIVKYKAMERNNKVIVKKIEIKISTNIKEGQKIIIRECGNYINEKNKYSDLIINILVKVCRRK